jgi:hypothetical protein
MKTMKTFSHGAAHRDVRLLLKSPSQNLVSPSILLANPDEIPESSIQTQHEDRLP